MRHRRKASPPAQTTASAASPAKQRRPSPRRQQVSCSAQLARRTGFPDSDHLPVSDLRSSRHPDRAGRTALDRYLRPSSAAPWVFDRRRRQPSAGDPRHRPIPASHLDPQTASFDLDGSAKTSSRIDRATRHPTASGRHPLAGGPLGGEAAAARESAADPPASCCWHNADPPPGQVFSGDLAETPELAVVADGGSSHPPSGKSW